MRDSRERNGVTGAHAACRSSAMSARGGIQHRQEAKGGKSPWSLALPLNEPNNGLNEITTVQAINDGTCRPSRAIIYSKHRF